METRIAQRTFRPDDAALDWSGKSRSARPARWTSLFGVDLWKANETKKARSVVALSRVPRGERGAPVSPPAAGRKLRKVDPLLRRLSGLLSGYLPTDTRPQARAKLGKAGNK